MVHQVHCWSGVCRQRCGNRFRTNIDNQVAANVRAERDRKLAACDWTALADSPLTTAKKTEWKTYRTALRNISAAEGFIRWSGRLSLPDEAS